MPANLSYPGVYIEEIPSGVRTIAGVSTSIALFVGRAASGPIRQPVRCLNYTEFVRAFSDDARFGELPRSVKLFFDNGGTDCFVVRVANGAAPAKITLKSEANADALILIARNEGPLGNNIRAAVTYAGARPEATFNLELFRWEKDSSGQLVKRDVEIWPNLSMDPKSQRYAVDLLDASKLVSAKAPGPIATNTAYSLSGRPLAKDTFSNDWNAINTTNNKTKLMLRVGNSGNLAINFGAVNSTGDDSAKLASDLQKVVDAALNGTGQTALVEFVAGPDADAGGTKKTYMLRISSTTGDVLVESSSEFGSDLAVPLMLGTSNGGLEVSQYAKARPAPTGWTLRPYEAATPTTTTALNKFGSATQADVQVQIDGKPSWNIGLITTAGTDRMYKNAPGNATATGENDGIREKLARIAAKINEKAGADRDLAVRAEVWGQRLAILPTGGPDSRVVAVTFTGTGDVSTGITTNVRNAGLGSAWGSFVGTPVSGNDGNAPKDSDYRDAYAAVDKLVDLFNLLVLPESGTLDPQADPIADLKQLWAEASVFCQKRRALLLMDPPSDWETKSVNDAATAVSQLRIGLAKNNAALFFPRLRVRDGDRNVNAGVAGAIAGLIARTDASRGVWKAPAGMDADLRGIVGLTNRLSDGENGVLNPRGINVLRVLPAGIVNWGARTMNGDDDFGSEWKYIPVRRLALYLEESLYRGTQWVVFEPNDEPLWSQIRLNIGTFMHSLFRQGAFQGKSPREAYFVKCDAETTTQADIDRGIVNVNVGFAPLKPAEFVVVRIQQMAGQLQA